VEQQGDMRIGQQIATLAALHVGIEDKPAFICPFEKKHADGRATVWR